MLSLNKLVACVCSYTEDVAEGTVELGTGSIAINHEGQVTGFKACLSQGIHLTVQQLLSSAWHVQFNKGGLVSPIDRDTHSLQDILRFVLQDTLDGTIKDIYDSRPYFLAVWDTIILRRKWSEITGDIMRLEGMT